MEDITDYLAFEVKKDLADRYFGFRKRIEDDTAAYYKRLTLTSLELENSIGFSLIRIYILLQDQELIDAFISLLGLPKKFYYDGYVISSPTIRSRLFQDCSLRGMTRRKRFKHLFFDTYNELIIQLGTYQQTLQELTEEHETIEAQIQLFYKNNDIDSIMGFINRLENNSGNMEMLQPQTMPRQESGLKAQLQLQSPPAASDLLPLLPLPPAGKNIQQQLKDLIKLALDNGQHRNLDRLTGRSKS